MMYHTTPHANEKIWEMGADRKGVNFHIKIIPAKIKIDVSFLIPRPFLTYCESPLERPVYFPSDTIIF